MRDGNKVPNFDPMLCTLSVVTQFDFNILKLKKKKHQQILMKIAFLVLLDI